MDASMFVLVSRYCTRCPYIISGIQILVLVSGYWSICLDISLGFLYISLDVWILAEVSIYWNWWLDAGVGVCILVQVSRYWSRCQERCLNIGPGVWILLKASRH